MPTLAEVDAVVRGLWPLDGAEAWDAPGLVSGDPAAPVGRILLAVDAVLATVDEAVAGGAQLLLTHHPLLLRGVTSVAEDRAKGVVLARLIRGGCAAIAAHTNADVVSEGTSDTLALRLGLDGIRPILPGADPAIGLGRIGDLPSETTLGRLAGALAAMLPATAQGIRVSGDYDQPVRRVALCAGAGDSLLGQPEVVASDVYITSDLRHHPASEAREAALVSAGAGPALIDTAHWASEWLWLDGAGRQLRAELPGVEIVVSDIRTDPWDFVVTQ